MFKNKSFIFDIDGTLVADNKLLPGAKEIIHFLTAKKIPFCFVTNSTSSSIAEIHSTLISLGIEVAKEKIVTPVLAIKDFLKKNNFKAIKIVKSPSLEPEFSEFAVVEEPEVIILADGRDGISQTDINSAFDNVLNGAEIFTLQANKFYAKNNKLVADLGFYVAGFEYITGKKIKSFGKPSDNILNFAAKKMGVLNLSDLVIVGDDIEFDILGSQKQGLSGVLVKTGKYLENVEEKYDLKPTLIVENVGKLLEIIKEEI